MKYGTKAISNEMIGWRKIRAIPSLGLPSIAWAISSASSAVMAAVVVIVKASQMLRSSCSCQILKT